MSYQFLPCTYNQIKHHLTEFDIHQKNNQHYVLIHYQNQCIGTLIYHQSEAYATPSQPKRNVRVIRIESLEIKKDYRRKGHGTRILHALVDTLNATHLSGSIAARYDAYSFWVKQQASIQWCYTLNGTDITDIEYYVTNQISVDFQWVKSSDIT